MGTDMREAVSVEEYADDSSEDAHTDAGSKMSKSESNFYFDWTEREAVRQLEEEFDRQHGPPKTYTPTNLRGSAIKAHVEAMRKEPLVRSSGRSLSPTPKASLDGDDDSDHDAKGAAAGAAAGSLTVATAATTTQPDQDSLAQASEASDSAGEKVSDAEASGGNNKPSPLPVHARSQKQGEEDGAGFDSFRRMSSRVSPGDLDGDSARSQSPEQPRVVKPDLNQVPLPADQAPLSDSDWVAAPKVPPGGAGPRRSSASAAAAAPGSLAPPPATMPRSIGTAASAAAPGSLPPSPVASPAGVSSENSLAHCPSTPDLSPGLEADPSRDGDPLKKQLDSLHLDAGDKSNHNNINNNINNNNSPLEAGESQELPSSSVYSSSSRKRAPLTPGSHGTPNNGNAPTPASIPGSFSGYESPSNGPATSHFLSQIREKRGTVLRAWCVDLDKKRNGQCTHAEFAQACRKMGFQPGEGQLFWTSLRPDGNMSALKFFEIDPEEAQNFDHLEKVLWDACNFDLEQAWKRIDPNHKMAVTEAEFRAGLRSLGFVGNAKILFHGLNTGGAGRLSRLDFEYVKRLSRLHALSSTSTPVVEQFRRWAREEFGSTAELLAELEIPEKGPGGAVPPGIGVKECSLRLEEVGFPGDCDSLSMLACLEGKGALVTGEKMRLIVGNFSPPLATGRSQTNPLSASLNSTGSRGVRHGRGWDNSKDNTGEANVYKPAGMRTYFSRPDRDVEQSPGGGGGGGGSKQTPANTPASKGQRSPSPKHRFSFLVDLKRQQEEEQEELQQQQQQQEQRQQLERQRQLKLEEEGRLAALMQREPEIESLANWGKRRQQDQESACSSPQQGRRESILDPNEPMLSTKTSRTEEPPRRPASPPATSRNVMATSRSVPTNQGASSSRQQSSGQPAGKRNHWRDKAKPSVPSHIVHTKRELEITDADAIRWLHQRPSPGYDVDQESEIWHDDFWTGQASTSWAKPRHPVAEKHFPWEKSRQAQSPSSTEAAASEPAVSNGTPQLRLSKALIEAQQQQEEQRLLCPGELGQLSHSERGELDHLGAASESDRPSRKPVAKSPAECEFKTDPWGKDPDKRGAYHLHGCSCSHKAVTPKSRSELDAIKSKYGKAGVTK